MKSSVLTRRAAALVLAGLMTLSPLNVLAAAPDGGGPGAFTPIAPIIVERVSFVEKNKTLEGDKPEELSLSIGFKPSGASRNVDIKWTSDATDVATVTPSADSSKKATVTPVAPGVAKITAETEGEEDGKSVKDICEITVSGLKMEKSTLDLFVNQEESLTCLRFGSVSKADVTWESNNVSVADVENGRISAYFPGEAVITAKAGRYEAKCTVTVREDVAEVVPGSLDAQRLCSFSSLVSTLNQRSLEKTGTSLVRLTSMSVPASQGLLTYGYLSPDAPGHGVGGTESYYVNPGINEKKLSDITFVPASGFAGKATISYTGYGQGGTPFFGKIQISVAPQDDVIYHTTQDHPAPFSAEDFQNVCQARTGRSADYLVFDPPAASFGALYRNYSVSGEYAKAITASDQVRVVDSETGDMLSFVPAKGFSGTVTIPYRCINSYGGSFSGKVTVIVQSGDSPDSTRGDVNYTTRQGVRVRLSGSDFDDACRLANNRPLHSVRFTSLPDQRVGTFFYDYDSRDPLRVNTNMSYYYGSAPSISRITFVPGSDFRGPVDVPFTGTDSYGSAFSGILHIQVGTGSNSQGGYISYHTTPGGAVSFQEDDFDWACRTATGNPLESVRFTLPSWRSGRLYYNGSHGDGQVSEHTSYYRSGSGRLLRDITFVSAGEPGEVHIDYTGWSTRGQRFYGTVVVSVDAPQSGTVRTFGSSLPIPLRTVDFQVACLAALGEELSSVRFTSLPSRSEGRLYLDGRPVGTYDSLTAADRQLDRLTFVARAGFQGVVRVPYEAISTQGKRTTGVLEVTVSHQYCNPTFTDMRTANWEWARPSVEFLRYKGVAKGCGNGAYCPARAVSRAEFVVMVCQAFGFTSSSPAGFTDVPANSYYASAVAAARERGIISGSNGRFRPNDALTRQDAVVILSHAMQAAGYGQPYASESVLYRYRDGSQVSAYARPAMAAMVQQGVINGDALYQLRPKAPISRAEIAVILHHGLTM